MRLAISEEWGGPESAEKRDFLISHICDTYSNEAAAAADSSQISPVVVPDIDDLAETLEMYFADEYESRIEDGSADWVAGRIVQLHKVIYADFPATAQSLANAQSEVDKLYQAAVQLRGQKVSVQRTSEQDEEGESASESERDGDEAMQIDDAQAEQTRQQRQEPIVDEEGFTTVVKGKRRP